MQQGRGDDVRAAVGRFADHVGVEAAGFLGEGHGDPGPLPLASGKVLGSQTVLLGEVASVTVRHPHLADYPGVPYQWDETLGCIWREPVDPFLGAGETVWPLAMVLHEDPAGDTAIAALAELSGRELTEWVSTLVSVTVRPLLHLLHTYGVSVNPHGENLMIICDAEGMPSRLVIKDLVDDVCVSTDPVPERSWEPDGHARVLPRKPWHVLRQYIVDALFLGVWGPLGELMDGHGLPVTSVELWNRTRQVITEYTDSHPEQAARLEATGFFGTGVRAPSAQRLPSAAGLYRPRHAAACSECRDDAEPDVPALSCGAKLAP